MKIPSPPVAPPLGRILTALAVVLLMSGCVYSPGCAPPPPPRHYHGW